MAKVEYPQFARDRGLAFWLRPRNIWSSRRKFLRVDKSVEWRNSHLAAVGGDSLPYLNDDAEFSVPFSKLASGRYQKDRAFRFLLMADTGEGDKSQYSLRPLIHALKPDFVIIAGDTVYPVGRIGETRDDDDFLAGLFEPYRGLGVPIWSVPGNHEYYSPHNGREYFETFCSHKYEKRWRDHGLSFVQQPSSFWELREPGREGDLVVIGIDTGMQGNLDGYNSWWQFWNRHDSPDLQQLDWLRGRLNQSQRLGNKVIALFHIPSLGNQRHDKSVHCRELHRLLGEFSCVKAVVAGHIHNYQHYAPDEFGNYLASVHGVARDHKAPHYFITGGGGAYLNSTEFRDSRWKCSSYPDAGTWIKNKSRWRSLVASAGLDRTFVGRIADIVERGALYDADTSELLSLILVDVTMGDGGTEVKMTPLYLENVDKLFSHLPENQVVDIMDLETQIDSSSVASCLGDPIML